MFEFEQSEGKDEEEMQRYEADVVDSCQQEELGDMLPEKYSLLHVLLCQIMLKYTTQDQKVNLPSE